MKPHNPETDNTVQAPAQENSPAEEQRTEPQGSFSLRPTGRKKPINWKIAGVIGGGVLLVLIIAIVFGAAVINSRSDNETEVDETRVKAEAITRSASGQDNDMNAFMDEHKEPEPAAPATNTPPAAQAPTTVSNQEHGNDNDTSPPEAPAREPETLFSSITRFDSSGASNGANGGGSDNGNYSAGAGYASGDEEQRLREFASADPMDKVRELLNNPNVAGNSASKGLLGQLEPTREYAQAKARKSPSPKYLLKRRTSFQCVLYTAIKTDYPGFVGCRLTRPLYSADGSVILAEAGAELLGEQNVEIKAGQTSVFTSWTELETAPGVRASLNGLGMDPMGRSGTDAYINNHYGQRYGGAVMLSFTKDALSTVSNRAKKSNGNGYNVDNTEQNAEDMASKALENSINIPPTGYVLPGTVLNVIVAQDIDFSSVYTTRR